MRKKGPTILLFMETKLVVREMEPIKYEQGFPSMLAVSSKVPCGGLALFWESKVVVNMQTYSPHRIDAQVLTPSSPPWRLTGIYGHLEKQMKLKTWKLLRNLNTRSSLPWMCIGDYNEILTFEEKNGTNPRPLPSMLEFQSTLLFCGLIDLDYSGYLFTWQNGRFRVAYVEERLDSACASLGWSKLFPTEKVCHLTASYFDHDPILLDIATSTHTQ